MINALVLTCREGATNRLSLAVNQTVSMDIYLLSPALLPERWLSISRAFGKTILLYTNNVVFSSQSAS